MSIAERPQRPSLPNRAPEGFVKRRPSCSRYEQAGIERRQFPNVGADLSLEAEELGQAIDLYKLMNRKQRINVEELLSVMRSLNYVKLDQLQVDSD